jgi:hypothetical protein
MCQASFKPQENSVAKAKKSAPIPTRKSKRQANRRENIKFTPAPSDIEEYKPRQRKKITKTSRSSKLGNEQKYSRRTQERKPRKTKPKPTDNYVDASDMEEYKPKRVRPKRWRKIGYAEGLKDFLFTRENEHLLKLSSGTLGNFIF